MVLNMARQRRTHSKEFKAEVVRLVLEGGQTAGAVARAYDLAHSLVTGWVEQAKVGRVDGRIADLRLLAQPPCPYLSPGRTGAHVLPVLGETF